MAQPDSFTRRDFQALSRIHLRAARSLLRSRQWQNAHHIAGYAAECALKACIAKRTRRHEFPRRGTRHVYTHNLTDLATAAELDSTLLAARRMNRVFDVYWTTVKDWTPASRYNLAVDEEAARELYRALTARQNGVMTWIRQRW